MSLVLQLTDSPILHFTHIIDFLTMKNVRLPQNMENLPPFIVLLEEDYISRFAGLLISQTDSEVLHQEVKDDSDSSWLV